MILSRKGINMISYSNLHLTLTQIDIIQFIQKVSCTSGNIIRIALNKLNIGNERIGIRLDIRKDGRIIRRRAGSYRSKIDNMK